MADFTSLILAANTGTQATPVWTGVLAAGKELRWADASTVGGSTASASWPYSTRPAATAGVDYCYAYTADAVGLGVIGTSGVTPAQWANTNYHMFRWDWDNTGTFASAPTMSAYPSSAHAAPTRGDNTVLGGNTTDTGATARSYFKGNLFGRVTSAGAPAAAPTNTAVVTDGATGSVNPTAGANWATNYQGLMGAIDYLTFPNTPAATTADQQECMLRLFSGPNQALGTLTWVVTLSYTYI